MAQKHFTGTLVLLMNLLMIQTSSGKMGNEGSGGGTAVVCRNPDKSIRFAELLDVYDWKNNPKRFFNMSLPKILKTGNEDEDQQLLDSALQKFLDQPLLKREYQVSLQKMLSINVPIIRTKIQKALSVAKKEFPGTYIASPTDMGKGRPIRLPLGCVLEFSVYYRDDLQFGEDDLVDVDHSIWDAFDITSRLALLVHEPIYSIRRRFFKDADAIESRDDTGMLVALSLQESEQAGWWPWESSVSSYRRVAIVSDARQLLVRLTTLENQMPSPLEKSKVKITLKNIHKDGTVKARRSTTIRLDQELQPVEQHLRSKDSWNTVSLEWSVGDGKSVNDRATLKVELIDPKTGLVVDRFALEGSGSAHLTRAIHRNSDTPVENSIYSEFKF